MTRYILKRERERFSVAQPLDRYLAVAEVRHDFLAAIRRQQEFGIDVAGQIIEIMRVGHVLEGGHPAEILEEHRVERRRIPGVVIIAVLIGAVGRDGSAKFAEEDAQIVQHRLPQERRPKGRVLERGRTASASIVGVLIA